MQEALQEKIQNRGNFDSRFTKVDTSLDKLDKSIDNNTEAIKDQTAAIGQLNSNLANFQSYWSKSIPIKLVYYIVAVIVAGQAAIALTKYFIPTP